MGDKVKLNQRWCLVEDKSRVVPENHPAARWLHWREGDEVDLDEAMRLGAVRHVGEPGPEKAPPRKRPAKKMQPAPANKQAKPPANKEGW